MAAPIFYRRMVLLAKLETAYGVDPTLTGAANAILAKNITIRPMEGQDVPRDLIQQYLGGQATIPAGLHVVLEFSTELAGSGVVATPPAWGLFMRGCGCAEVVTPTTSVSYSPISENMESVYLKFWLGTTLHALKGARGDATITLDAQGIPSVRWMFTGLFVDPTDVAQPVQTLTGFKKPLIASALNTPTFTINAVPLVLRSWSLKLGNRVEPRLLMGTESIVIPDRSETLDVGVEVTPLATFDPHALAKSQSVVPSNIVHGITPGNIITLSAPACQIKRPAGYDNNQGVAERTLSLTPLPISGNDQFTLTLT